MFRHRVARNRILYVAVILCIVGLFAYLVLGHRWEFYQLLLLALVFVIPGRIVRLFWKEYVRAQRRMQHAKYAEAIELYRDFLARIEGHPWLKWLVFFTYGVYTFRIEAVVHTEIARAHLYIGELNEAGKQLHIALEYDTRYAVAFYYLAVLEVLKHNVPDAEKHFIKARQNGYPKVTFQEFLELVHEEFK